MKKTALPIAILLSFLILPHISLAGFMYSSIKRISGDTVTVEKDIMKDEKPLYNCSISTLVCNLQTIAPEPSPSKSVPSVVSKNLSTKGKTIRTLWSPDGTSLVFVRKYGSTYYLERYSVTKGTQLAKKSMLYDGTSRLTISPTGRYIAYYNGAKANTKPERTYYLTDLVKKITYTKTEKILYWDQVADQDRVFEFASDESSLAYINDFADPMMVHILPLPTTSFSGKAIIADKEFSVADFIYGDKNTIIFTGHGKASYDWSLYRYDMKSKKYELLAKNVSWESALWKAGNTVLFHELGNGTAVPALYDLSKKTISYFDQFHSDTSLLPGLRAEVTFGTMHGVLVKPAVITATTPLLIWLHGGPYRQAAWGYHSWSSYGVYDWALDEALKSGAMVLKLDYRGSKAHGRAFSENIRHNIGLGDVTDVETAIAGMRSTTTFGNVYLAGNSYGGYLGLKAVVERPSLITGVLSINGVTDWQNLIQKIPSSIFAMDFDGPPSNPKTKVWYDQANILSHIGNLTNQKIIIAHASQDTTIFPSQAPLLYGPMIALGKNAEFVSYDGDNHVLRDVKNIEKVCHNILSLFGTDDPTKCVFPQSN